MGAPVMQPARHAAAPALRNAARAHASVLMVLTPGADGTPTGHRPKGRSRPVQDLRSLAARGHHKDLTSQGVITEQIGHQCGHARDPGRSMLFKSLSMSWVSAS